MFFLTNSAARSTLILPWSENNLTSLAQESGGFFCQRGVVSLRWDMTAGAALARGAPKIPLPCAPAGWFEGMRASVPCVRGCDRDVFLLSFQSSACTFGFCPARILAPLHRTMLNLALVATRGTFANWHPDGSNDERLTQGSPRMFELSRGRDPFERRFENSDQSRARKCPCLAPPLSSRVTLRRALGCKKRPRKRRSTWKPFPVTRTQPFTRQLR